MGVFSNSTYGQQGIAATPDFVGANRTSALVQAQNQARKDANKQQNLTGGFQLANALREGGTENGGSVLGDMGSAVSQGWKGSSAAAGMGSTVAPATAQAGLGNLAMNAAPVANTAGAGAFTLGGAEAASAAALAGSAPAAGAAAATGAGAAGGFGGAMAGAGAAMASNPVGWAAMAALAAYSLFG